MVRKTISFLNPLEFGMYVDCGDFLTVQNQIRGYELLKNKWPKLLGQFVLLSIERHDGG